MALWRSILAGRAHVVDRFRVDGQAFLVVKREEAAHGCALSPREKQIAIAAASGQALKTIAFDLGVTTNTVASHLRSVKTKTGLAGRKEIAFWFSFRSSEGEASLG